MLLVHGHWYYYRAGNLVQYFFYKNIVCFTAQLYFSFFNSFSTQTLFDEMNLTMYNIIYTSIPVFVFGLFEKNCDDHVLLSNPELYKRISKNALLSLKVSLSWFFDAFWASIVTFFAFYLLFINNSSETLHDNLGMLSFGLSIYQSVVVVVSFRLLVHSRYWNVLLLLSIFVSLFALLCFNLTYHSLIHFEMYKVIFHVLSSPTVWLSTLLCTCLCLLPYILIEYVNTTVWPSLFGGNHNDAEQEHRENLNNNDDAFVSDMVHDRNITNGISIIGSATAQQTQNEYSNVHTSYAFINPGFVADTSESTRL